MTQARYAWLPEVDPDTTVVLTSSRRLAEELRFEFAEQRVASGQRVWSTPQIVFWRDWCRRASLLAEQETEHAISSTASALIWERCIRDELPTSLVDESGLANLARTTWQRLHDWQVPIEELSASAATPDESFFARVAGAYRRTLERGGWVDDEALVAACPERIGQLRSPPRRVMFAGFDRNPPIIDALSAALARADTVVEDVPLGREADRRYEDCFSHRACELRAAGSWARQILLDNPLARVAIVVADLHAHAGSYRRLVTEGFLPGWQAIDSPDRDAVNVSFGQPLIDFPMIETAVRILRLLATGLRSAEVSALIRSPFFPISSPQGVALLDAGLRRQPNRRWTAAAIASAAELWSAAAGLRENGGFDALARLYAEAEDQRALSAWAPAMEALLREVGWPGERVLSSREFQILNRWRELLNQLASLDSVSPPVTLRTAVRHLARCAAEAMFQPESRHRRVQLLGVLEAAGMRFDHLWVAGMEAAQWPPAPRPLAMVAHDLQRRRRMPDSTAEDTLTYARRVLRRLVKSANSVRCTWSQQSSDGNPQTRSPLLGELGLSASEETRDPGWYAAKSLNAARTTRYIDAPPPAKGERLQGGSRTLNLQLQEPFAAFALGRLAAREIDPFEAGLPPRMRGSLFHKLLAALLSDVPDQSAIARWRAEDVSQRIDLAADRVFGTEFRKADALTRRLLALERRRQRAILGDFLAKERARPPFEIEGLELPLVYERSGVELSLRADRIDRVGDGSLLLIDYKTGALAPLLNVSGDPTDFQLVLYAMAAQQPVGGLVLTFLRKPTVEYRGVGSDWNEIAPSQWHTQLQGWMQQVEQACDQLASGDARLNAHRKGITPPQLTVLSRDAEVRRES